MPCGVGALGGGFQKSQPMVEIGLLVRIIELSLFDLLFDGRQIGVVRGIVFVAHLREIVREVLVEVEPAVGLRFDGVSVFDGLFAEAVLLVHQLLRARMDSLPPEIFESSTRSRSAASSSISRPAASSATRSQRTYR